MVSPSRERARHSSQYCREIVVMLSERASTRREVNPLLTNLRSRACRGSSIARKDMVLYACGPYAAGSRETPIAFEKTSGARNASRTSECLLRAQNPSSGLW